MIWSISTNWDKEAAYWKLVHKDSLGCSGNFAITKSRQNESPDDHEDGLHEVGPDDGGQASGNGEEASDALQGYKYSSFIRVRTAKARVGTSSCLFV